MLMKVLMNQPWWKLTENKEFNNRSLSNISLRTLKCEPTDDYHVTTKVCFDSFGANEIENVIFFVVFSEQQHNKCDKNKLPNLRITSFTIFWKPSADSELSNKKYVNDSKAESTIFRLNQTIGIFLTVSVGNTVYILRKWKKEQIFDIAIINYPQSDGYLLKKTKKECYDKSSSRKLQNFVKSAKTAGPSGNTGATTLPWIGDWFLYIKTNCNQFGEVVFF